MAKAKTKIDVRRVAITTAIAAVLTTTVVSAYVFQQEDTLNPEAQARTEARNQGAGSETIRRPGSVILGEAYDLSDLSIPLEQIHTLLPKDAIPSLTDPETEKASELTWLDDGDRVLFVEIEGEAYAAPLKILNFHEVVNTTVGGEPVALTYCPLCDSATAFSRRVQREGDEPIVLEFGVSGALYNSNVLMFDRTFRGLWSQLGMHAVSGPMAGAGLEHLPARLVSLARFRAEYPDGLVVSRDTGHVRPYDRNAYAGYFETDETMVPVWGIGDEIKKKKTLGVGVEAGAKSWFITADAIGAEGMTLQTPMGPVELAVSDAGIDVVSAPEGVNTAQTFYYSWSAFRPETEVIAE